MLGAIAAAKKNNDRINANKICDCRRRDFLPECHMASTAIRERRRTQRYRNLPARQLVQMKNKISEPLMEAGVAKSQNPHRLESKGTNLLVFVLEQTGKPRPSRLISLAQFHSSQREVRPLILRRQRERFGGERRPFLRFRDEE